MSNVTSEVNSDNNTIAEYPKLYNVNNLTVTNADASFDRVHVRFQLRYISSLFSQIEYILKIVSCGNNMKMFYRVKSRGKRIDAEVNPADGNIHNMLSGTRLEFMKDKQGNGLTCTVDMVINQTRFLAVHFKNRPHELTANTLASMEVGNDLFTYQHERQETLDDKDNFLNEELYNATRGHFPQYTSIIIAKAIEWLDNKIQHHYCQQYDDCREHIIAGHPFYLRLNGQTEISISSIETYFEYKTTQNHAVYNVYYLTPVINALVDDMTFVDHALEGERERENRNIFRDMSLTDVLFNSSQAELPISYHCGASGGKSRCIQVNISGSGQTKVLKIYAKTMNRIRFEEAFSRNVKQFCGAEGLNTFNQLPQFMERVINEAVSRINVILRKMSDYVNINTINNNLTAFELLTELIMELSKLFPNDKPKVNEIVQMLLTQNRLTEAKDGLSIKNMIINKMIDANIIIGKRSLRKKNTTGFISYPLHPRYAAFSQKMLSVINA
ncbi:hypothetical protein [Candidatus Deianiraea vastatrix]|uniref:Uncharacterized protein n=1 Tax=Candidatus Deianiraea vastatrix TaxID=2163644 RepID=A0A5B8XCF0_9RICK|nr:hypothetical protein [Candidatus Deianiraea vastatrix]QED23012.1 hypothetical protein Deia_00204 [Candidatus Deianiraea vastatrix]